MDVLKTRIETPLWRESMAFYTEDLGMNVVASWDDPGDRGVILALGGGSQPEALLELAHTDAPRSYTGLSLQFRVRDLAAVAERLKTRGMADGPAQRPWGSAYLTLLDPAGVRVILYQEDP